MPRPRRLVSALAVVVLAVGCGGESEQERLARRQNDALDAVESAAVDANSDRAKDRAAQSSLRNTLTAAKTIFTDNETYEDATIANLSQSEPSLTFVEDVSTGPTVVVVDVVSASTFVATSRSATGTCFAIRDDAGFPSGPGTRYASADSATCGTAVFSEDDFASSWAS